MFCALLMSRYQVSVYRTNGPLVFIFDKVIRIAVNVPSIRNALSIGSLNGNTCL